MDLLVDLLVEVVFNIFAQGFVSLSAAFMPNKTLSPRTEKILTIIFCLIGICLLVLLVLGVVMLVESRGDNLIGWIFIGVCIIYILLSIASRIVAKKQSFSRQHDSK